MFLDGFSMEIVFCFFHEMGNVDYIIMFSHFDPFFLLNK